MATSSRWINCSRPNPQAHLRLFCLPHAGGGASLFYDWPDHLPKAIEVLAIQLPGRENRFKEPPFTQLSDLLSALEQALQPYLNKPFALFGHSLGALIGFEFARRIRRNSKQSPAHLFVSGRCAPQLTTSVPPVHHLPDSEFMAELRRLDGTPETILQDPTLLRLFLPLLRADFTIHETYVYAPEPPLDCPISVFGGDHDNTVGYDELKAWREQTVGLFRLRMFSGDHFFLQSSSDLILRAISHGLAAHSDLDPDDQE